METKVDKQQGRRLILQNEPFYNYLRAINPKKEWGLKANKIFVSPSLFKSKDTPLDVLYNLLSPPDYTSAALLEGSAFHLLVSEKTEDLILHEKYGANLACFTTLEEFNEFLETETEKEWFKNNILLINEKDLPDYPNIEFRKKGNREYRDRMLQRGKMEGKIVVFNVGEKNKNQLFRLYKMRKAVLLDIHYNTTDENDNIIKSYPLHKILKKGEMETSFYYYDEEMDVYIKFRPDWYSKILALIIDFKTVSTADYYSFYYDSVKYGYDQQAAFYIDYIKKIFGIDMKFAFILVEKTAPFKTEFLVCDEEYIDGGRIKYKRRMRLLKEAFSTKIFRGYSVNHPTNEGYRMLNKVSYADKEDRNW